MTVDEFIAQWRSPSSYITAHTSGSTGKPKPIQLDKEFVRASARRTNTFFNINASSRLHLPLSVDYIAGKMMVVRALEANATLTHEPPSNNPQLLPHGLIHLLAVVPSQMDALLKADHTNVRNYLIGGSAISPALRTRIANAHLSAWESYGMTETASHIALRPVDGDQPFTTLPGISCSLGHDGNLIITLPTTTIATRDAAELLDQHHFRILGRLDNTIITGGVKVYPEQVERKIALLGWQFPYCVGSIPDSKWTNRLVLYIDASASTFSSSSLLQAMRTVLDGPQLPRTIIRLTSFRYTTTGKLIRP